MTGQCLSTGNATQDSFKRHFGRRIVFRDSATKEIILVQKEDIDLYIACGVDNWRRHGFCSQCPREYRGEQITRTPGATKRDLAEFGAIT